MVEQIAGIDQLRKYFVGLKWSLVLFKSIGKERVRNLLNMNQSARIGD